jgi:hypothetical protein
MDGRQVWGSAGNHAEAQQYITHRFSSASFRRELWTFFFSRAFMYFCVAFSIVIGIRCCFCASTAPWLQHDSIEHHLARLIIGSAASWHAL